MSRSYSMQITKSLAKSSLKKKKKRKKERKKNLSSISKLLLTAFIKIAQEKETKAKHWAKFCLPFTYTIFFKVRVDFLFFFFNVSSQNLPQTNQFVEAYIKSSNVICLICHLGSKSFSFKGDSAVWDYSHFEFSWVFLELFFSESLKHILEQMNQLTDKYAKS